MSRNLHWLLWNHPMSKFIKHRVQFPTLSAIQGILPVTLIELMPYCICIADPCCIYFPTRIMTNAWYHFPNYMDWLYYLSIRLTPYWCRWNSYVQLLPSVWLKNSFFFDICFCFGICCWHAGIVLIGGLCWTKISEGIFWIVIHSCMIFLWIFTKC